MGAEMGSPSKWNTRYLPIVMIHDNAARHDFVRQKDQRATVRRCTGAGFEYREYARGKILFIHTLEPQVPFIDSINCRNVDRASFAAIRTIIRDEEEKEEKTGGGEGRG